MIEQKSKHIQADGIDIVVARSPSDYTGKAVIGKIGKTLSDHSVAYKRMINVLLESGLTTGELLTADDQTYLITMVRPLIIQGQKVSLIAYGLLCNATLTVTRNVVAYDEYGNQTGSTVETAMSSSFCHAIHVNGKMREADNGLLDTTVMKVYSIASNGLVKGDKAQVAGNYYQVDDINYMESPGCMVLQLSVWTG